MKTNGKKISGVHEDVMVIPRGADQLVFKGRAVQDFTTFHTLCPPPAAPKITKATGVEEDLEDKGYLAQVDNWSKQKFGWIIMTTLYDTEFETLDAEIPATWIKWPEEMADSGLSDAEQTAIVQFVLRLNTLSSEALDEARQAFLRSTAE